MIEAPTAPTLSNAADDVRLVNGKLLEYLLPYRELNPELVEAAGYAVESPGHRWRPILFLAIYDKLAQTTRDMSVLQVPCAIEYVHTASILYDDLPAADNGTLRRGKKACHLQFGETRTMHTATWLCNVAQQLLHNFQANDTSDFRYDLGSGLRSTIGEMMRGQFMDLECKNLTEEQIIEKYRLKSGALYAFTASAPARLLGQDRLAHHLSAFGNCLGIAYQISDDIHDQSDSVEVLGKDVHKDDNKSTIPALVGTRKAVEMRDFYKLQAINELSMIPTSIDALVELVDRICV